MRKPEKSMGRQKKWRLEEHCITSAQPTIVSQFIILFVPFFKVHKAQKATTY